jgi:hypothetical protein
MNIPGLAMTVTPPATAMSPGLSHEVISCRWWRFAWIERAPQSLDGPELRVGTAADDPSGD